MIESTYGLWAMSEAGFACLNSLKLTHSDAVSCGDYFVYGGSKNYLPSSISNGIATIDIVGPMTKQHHYPGRVTSTRAVRSALRLATENSDVSTIVLRLDTPGGSVDGLPLLADEVNRAKGTKQVIAQVDGMLASAGYYVGSQADTIHANSLDLIGSIGTRMMVYDYSGMFEQEGVKAIPIDTGEFKSAGAFGTELSEAQKTYFQSLVDQSFQDFKSRILAGRPAMAGTLEEVADGRVFKAEDAVNLGLIDRVMTLEDTLASIAPANQGRSTVAARKRLAL